MVAVQPAANARTAHQATGMRIIWSAYAGTRRGSGDPPKRGCGATERPWPHNQRREANALIKSASTVAGTRASPGMREYRGPIHFVLDSTGRRLGGGVDDV